MKNHLYIKNALSALLIFALLLSLSVSLISCAGGIEPSPDDDTPATDENGNSEGGAYLVNVVKPAFKDYGRATVNFSEITYKRPDFTAINQEIDRIISVIEQNSQDYEEQYSAVMTVDDSVSSLLTMFTVSRIYSYKNSGDKYWSEEFEFISTSYSSMAKKVEELKVAAANSPHCDSFARDVFGEGFIEKYRDGSNLTEKAAQLFADEAAFEAQYSALSTATVEITYNGATDTADNIISYYLNKYGSSSKKYLSAYSSCIQLYNERHSILSSEILMELFKIRRLIADEYGYQNYLEYCYSERDADYTAEDISGFISDIADFIYPVYIELYPTFYYYFSERSPEAVGFDTLLNTGYEVLRETDGELFDIYCYMLQHGLFDIEKSSANRYSGAFTTYLYDYNAPYLFISGAGDITDYTTLFHEFGHFADNYINEGMSSSLDVSEITSQALELLTMDALSEKIGREHQIYLLYSSLKNALETLIFQGFYARFEELAYMLPYSDITEASINEVISVAADDFNMNRELVNSLDDIIIPHFISSPVYVHSYCTSIIPSLEIYFMEDGAAGSGLEAYKIILNRTEENDSFGEVLKLAGLTSPFEEGHLKSIADKIYFKIVGSHFYPMTQGGNAA